MNIFNSGLIISGGGFSESVGKSVEVFVPSTGQHCKLPDMPGRRYKHTMDAKTVCGGVDTFCLSLTDVGTWERTCTLLTKKTMLVFDKLLSI